MGIFFGGGMKVAALWGHLVYGISTPVSSQMTIYTVPPPCVAILFSRQPCEVCQAERMSNRSKTTRGEPWAVFMLFHVKDLYWGGAAAKHLVSNAEGMKGGGLKQTISEEAFLSV